MLSPKLTPLMINDNNTKMSELSILSIETPQEYVEYDFKNIDNDELTKICSELYTTDNVNYRLDILNHLWKHHNDLCIEYFHKINVQYLYNPQVEMNELILIKIIKESILPIELKYECAKSIYCEYKERISSENTIENVAYDLFLYILSIENSEIPDFYINSIIKVQIIQYLLESYNNMENVKDILYKFMIDKNLHEYFKFLSVLQLAENPNTKSEYVVEMFRTICFSRVLRSRYIILASQFMLGNSIFSMEDKLEVENIILSMCRDNHLDYDLRADAADLLLTQGITETTRQIALDTIIALGLNRGALANTSIYDNKQNVHDISIEESVKKAIEYLASINLETKDGVYVTYNDTCKEIISEYCKMNNIEINNDCLLLKDVDKQENESNEIKEDKNEHDIKENEQELEDIDNEFERISDKKDVNYNLGLIKASLLRFSLDRALYSNFQKIQTLFIKVWQIIKSHEYKETLTQRLLEELIEMSGSCSSGHVSRLINVLSGFEIDGKMMNLTINYKDEMTSVMMTKINKIISQIGESGKPEDEKYQNDILEEMMWTTNLELRFTFNKFFRDNIIQIRNDLLQEYVTDQKLMDMETFEINFRAILEKFEY